MVKGYSLTRKDMIKEGISEYQEGRKNTANKIWVNTMSFSPEFSKLCLTVKAKIITLYDMVLKVCKENI